MKIPSTLSFGLKLTLQLAPYRTIAFLYAIFVILNGFMLIVYERDVPNSNLQSVYNGFWTMAITQATVGYGDFMPRTDMGRVLAVVTAGAAIVFNSLVLTISLRKLKLTIKEMQFLVQVRQRKKLPAAEVVTLLQRWVRLRLARKHCKTARFALLLKYIQAVAEFKVMRRRVFQKDRRELKQVIQGTGNRVGQQLKKSINRYQRLTRYASVLAGISTKQVAITSKLMILKRRLFLILELDKSPRVHRTRRKELHMATNAKRKQASELAFKNMLHHRFGLRSQTEAGRASTTIGDGTPVRQ